MLGTHPLLVQRLYCKNKMDQDIDSVLGISLIFPFFFGFLQGIIQRDEMVFEWARNSHSIPIIMVTSGGYQQKTGPIIAQSILNLREKKLVSCEAAEEYIKGSR